VVGVWCADHGPSHGPAPAIVWGGTTARGGIVRAGVWAAYPLRRLGTVCADACIMKMEVQEVARDGCETHTYMECACDWGAMAAGT